MSYQAVSSEMPLDLENSSTKFESFTNQSWSKYTFFAGIVAVTVLLTVLVLPGGEQTVSGGDYYYGQDNKKDMKDICLHPMYSKTTLKTAKEEAMAGLFYDLKGQKKFEASDITSIAGYLYVVFDNLWSIGRVEEHLPFNSQANTLVGAPGIDSGFEAIFYDYPTQLFYAVQEAVVEKGKNTESGDKEFHARILEMSNMNDPKGYTIERTCHTEFRFNSENKGFEGAVHVNKDNTMYILGLCEGNYCEGGGKGRDTGNGRVVIMKKSADSTDKNCYYETVERVKLPTEVEFVDYSAISIHHDPADPAHIYNYAISSQESAAVALGKLDIRDFSFKHKQISYFPRDDDCNIVYCNVEGIHFVEGKPQLLAAVSDKMKARGKQSFRCFEKDQSVHLFVMP